MKRILFSFLGSAAFMIFYATVVLIIQLTLDLSDQTIKPFATPLRLPSYLYYDVFHLKDNDENLLEAIILVSTAFLFNVVMYSPFFYLVFTLFSRFRPKQKEETQLPPLPPTFESER